MTSTRTTTRTGLFTRLKRIISFGTSKTRASLRSVRGGRVVTAIGTSSYRSVFLRALLANRRPLASHSADDADTVQKALPILANLVYNRARSRPDKTKGRNEELTAVLVCRGCVQHVGVPVALWAGGLRADSTERSTATRTGHRSSWARRSESRPIAARKVDHLRA